MTILVAVTDNREGHLALTQGIAEAEQLGTDLVAINLATSKLDLSGLDTHGVSVTVVDRLPQDSQDSADVILDEIANRQATRLVIGVKRRTPVGKAILGSLSQTLILNAPIPVLAVKLPEGELTGGAFQLPSGVRQVTG